MATNLQSMSPNDDDSKTFRKPSNDAAQRKYRRRSPVSGSSSSDGSPNHDRNSSPITSREAPARDYDHRRSKDDGRELDRDSGRSHYGRYGDRHSGRHSSRSSHNYHRHDDYPRRDKHAEEDRKFQMHSGRESRGGDRADYARREFRDSLHDAEKYSRDKSGGPSHKSRDKERETLSREYPKFKDKDTSSHRSSSDRRNTNTNVEESMHGERDRRDVDIRDEKMVDRTLGDHKTDRVPTYEESWGHRNDSASQRHSSGRRSKETNKGDPKETSSEKYSKEGKNKYDDNKHKERRSRELGDEFEEKNVSTFENQESDIKKQKVMSSDRVSKFSTMADERQTSTAMQGESVAKEYDLTSDIDAAKVAAMKAAELVNKNLIGTGYLSTDQKKKLLWGNKKNASVEETAHRWDAPIFTDRERQEKFNKLMGVKGEVKVVEQKNPTDNIQQQEGVPLLQTEKQKEVQLDLEKQYTAGLRRRDGRTVGLGL